MKRKTEQERARFRYNVVTVVVYLLGGLLLLQLFNLQIIHGQEYRDQSNVRLTRESTLEAARGSILDRTGNVIAGTKMGFSLELYKTKIDTQTLNSTILNIVNVLEKNQDAYVDSFPIAINPFSFNLSSEERIAQWKKENDIDENASAEDCFYHFKEKYKITNDNMEEVRKIIRIRYEIAQKGYSNTKAIELASDIKRESAIEFNERSSDFSGVNVVVEPIREYREKTLASHILGYIGKIDKQEYDANKELYNNDDYIGKSGIEYVFEKYLKGQNGVKQIDMNVDGTVTDEYISEEAIAGNDIVLTIDANLQKVAEQALQANIKKINDGGFASQYNTNSGSVVVMNVKTGEILAMASCPDYNPQDFINLTSEKWQEYNSPSKPLYNRSVQGSYAPGSIFKMVPAVASLELGKVSTTEKINDTGIYPLAHKPKCWIWTDYHRGHGWLNVSGAIQHSCNYFFYEMGNRIGIDNLEKYATYFGLGRKTGIELPSETTGTLAKRSIIENKGGSWYLGDTLSAVIGQSYNEFSPIQMVRYISMLSNGGKPIKPTLIKSIIGADGTEVQKEEIENYVNQKLGLEVSEQEDLHINSKNLTAVLEGMRSVTTESGGTAYSFFKNFNIEVGGKTGSAEAGDKVNAWFAGFAPFDNPEIAVVVLVENGGHGSYTAEVVRDIIAEYFGMNAKQVKEDVTAIPYTESIR